MARFFTTSLFASSSFANLTTYIAKARHIQQPEEKTCLQSPFLENLELNCDAENKKWVHRTICTAENNDFFLEAKCSCYKHYWNILLPREECIWESNSIPKPATEATVQTTTIVVRNSSFSTLESSSNPSTTPATTTKTSTATMTISQNNDHAREISLESSKTTCELTKLSPNFNWSCESDDFHHGITCFASCEKGFRIDKPGNARVTCSCADETTGCKWENSRVAVREHLFDGIGEPGILEGGLLSMKCLEDREDECALPDNIENGFFHCPNGQFIGSRCQIICNAGFSLPSGMRSAVKCTKKSSWNADVEAIRCESMISLAGERGLGKDNRMFCEAPKRDEDFVGEYQCESPFYADRSKCLLKCPPGFVSSTKSPKQNWTKCRCREKSGGCRWSRQNSIGCVALGNGTMQFKPIAVESVFAGRRASAVINNLKRCPLLEEQLDKNFRRPKCTHGSEENSFCILNCKLGRTLDVPQNAWRKCSCSESDGSCFWIGDPVLCS